MLIAKSVLFVLRVNLVSCRQSHGGVCYGVGKKSGVERLKNKGRVKETRWMRIFQNGPVA